MTRARTDQVRGTPTERGYGSHWRRVIRPAFLRLNPLCELCSSLAEVPDHWPVTREDLVRQGVADPDAFERMRPLCKDCHDRYGLSSKPWRKRSVQLNTAVTLVAGPPCAGKNTYIDEHRKPWDTVIDYDEIMARLSGRPLHEHDESLDEAVRAERDGAIATLLASGRRGWICATAPRRNDRHRHATAVVLLLPTQTLAMERATLQRPPSWPAYVRRWYERYEPDDRDTLVAV